MNINTVDAYIAGLWTGDEKDQKLAELIQDAIDALEGDSAQAELRAWDARNSVPNSEWTKNPTPYRVRAILAMNHTLKLVEQKRDRERREAQAGFAKNI